MSEPSYSFDLEWVEVAPYPGAKRSWVLRYKNGDWPGAVENDEFFDDD